MTMAQQPFDSDVTRRRFLVAVAAPLVASACVRSHFKRSDFLLAERSTVCLYDASTYDGDLSGLVGRGLHALGVNVRGKRVLLKPNLVEYEKGTVINTHPAVIGGAVEAFRRAGAAGVVVGEGPGHRRDVEYLLTGTGLYDYLSDLDTRFVDLNHSDVRPVRLRSWFTQLRQVWLPAELLEADFIVSMPKLKTHHFTGMTGSMKNLFGLVPGAVYGWPKNVLHACGIENSILDLNSTIRTDLTITDAIVGMEGDGPIMGHPKALGFIAMGTDPVAVDATCARAVGLDPARVPYLAAASAFLGHMDVKDIEQRGERLERYRTEFALPARFQSARLFV
jgi:uncharacterized protein (DUF362 family)